MAQNPFRYGGIARGAHFADRERELASLLEEVRSGQNVVVVSPRRFGKTSLVERAIGQLRHEGVLVAYLDLFRAPTKERLADHLAQAIYDGLVAPLDRGVRRAASFFAHLPLAPRLTLTDTGRPALEFTAFERHEDVDRALEGLLAMPGRIAGERERRVALVLDEFQEVVAIDASLTGLMRSVFQAQDEVAHVFLGSRRHLMEPLFMARGEPLYRTAKPLALGPIEREPFARFMRRRFRAGEVEVADAAVERILDLTAGRPYETQELCSFTWSRASGAGTPAVVATVELALDDLLNAESARYAAVWDELAPRQRAVVLALARERGELYSEPYRRRHKLGSPGSVRHALGRLVERELVERDGRRWQVSDVFLREWLARL